MYTVKASSAPVKKVRLFWCPSPTIPKCRIFSLHSGGKRAGPETNDGKWIWNTGLDLEFHFHSHLNRIGKFFDALAFLRKKTFASMKQLCMDKIDQKSDKIVAVAILRNYRVGGRLCCYPKPFNCSSYEGWFEGNDKGKREINLTSEFGSQSL
ncbi:hypothetical protein VNO78_34112 [Psophocarpus tetragonolobus]|uniref:Uncharacterized protein n=1 Tax=Psophocarpus tetragonolobus TaxID=3891 RepID=A0AAN9NZ91_PSOTE